MRLVGQAELLLLLSERGAAAEDDKGKNLEETRQKGIKKKGKSARLHEEMGEGERLGW